MYLYKFEKAHKFFDEKNIPSLKQYSSNVIIIERRDFTKEEKKGDIEWRDDGVYLNVNGNFQRGFMYIKRADIKKYKLPKFHLFQCKTILDKKQKGQFHNHYFWSNSKLVTVIQRGSNIEHKDKLLELCSNCKAILNERNFPNINNTEDFYNLLDINDIERENNSEPQETDIFNRPFNWNKISRAYREKQNYTCEECGFGGDDLDNNYDKRYIHTHHINSNELQNTHTSNLKALCVLCHFNQDEHHISNSLKRKNNIELKNFVMKYREKLLKHNNSYIQKFLDLQQ